VRAATEVPRHLGEVVRFMVVGGAATLVALTIFNVLVHGLLTGRSPLAGQPVTAYVLANAVGMLVSYQGSRSWVFRDRAATAADGGFTAYVVINVATMTLPVACLVLSRGVLGLDDPVSDNVAANGVGLLLGQAARYVLFRSLVFRGEVPADDPGVPVVGAVVPAPSPVRPAGRPTTTSTHDPGAPPAPAARAG
jgi:putative flippase GtrA